MSNQSSEANHFFIVAIGASAGGVQALEQFFGNLPDNPNAAFVVIQHLSPNHRSMMAEILRRKTQLSVVVIENEMEVTPGQVYVLPPGHNLQLREGRLCLENQAETFDYPINRFFQSVANQWGEQTIAILLSGTGNDGTDGLQSISRVGGIALVQSPETAQFTSMPTSAIPSGLVDEILSPQQLAQSVYDLVRFSANYAASTQEETGLIDTNQLQRILEILAEREEIDFSHYKISTLSRRICHRVALTRSSNLLSYIQLLQDSEQEQKLLRQDLLIGATCFFRDRPAWDFLEAEVLPQLIEDLQPQQQLRIWVSACATGEEAYTMAILVDEAIQKANKEIHAKIFATDLDNNALEVVASGVYPESISNDLTSERLERYFTHSKGHYQVKRSLREMLIVAPHDLTKNAGFSRMDLVTCRNVLIYMQPQLQQQVLRLLHFATANQGILFLGSSETLGELQDEFTPLNAKWKIFRKKKDNHLSLLPITRQALVTPLRPSSKTKKKQSQLDRLLAEVFKYCLGERRLTCLLVNSNNQLLRLFHNTAHLLEFPVGETILDITEIVPSELKLPLSTALHRAKRDQQPVLYTGIKLERNGEEEIISLKVGSDKTNPALEDYLIVVLEVETQTLPPTAALRFEVEEEAAQQITELEYELQQTRENLQITIEELETTNEEQQATNEELLASNEELQSTNEELQSVNEELYTVNAEYQNKIQELTQLNNDIDNLLRSTDIGVVFLDRHLNIRKFTPAATKAINIKSSDMGRPLTDLTNNLDCPQLLDRLQQVLEEEEPFEQEVTLLNSKEQLLMRINPYLQDDNQSDGIVLTFVNINHLKSVERDLHNSNAILETLFNNNPVGLCLFDSELRFMKINPALAKINGLPIEEHLGKKGKDLFPNLADTVEPILRQVLETKQPVENIEITGTTPATPEQERVWNISYYPVDLFDGKWGVGVVVTEISARLEIEEALRRSQERLIQAQHLAKLGNWEIEVSEDFDLATATPSFSEELFEIYGFNPHQTVPPLGELIQGHPPEARQALWDALTNLITEGTPFNLDLGFHRSNGELRYLNIIGRASCNEEGEITELYGATMDITKRKQVEAELLAQKQSLEEAIAIAQAADSANTAKSEFLANMSHEIRTPLNAILGVSQLLETRELKTKYSQLLKTLTSNSQKLLTLINDILELSKIEARELKLDPRPFPLSLLRQLLLDSFASQAQNKDLEFTIEIDPNLPSTLVGDDFRIQQVLSNLIANSFKFTQQGAIRVTISPSPEQKSNSLIYLRFAVSDTGIGIADDIQDNLFQPFTQADNSTTRQYGGTGLGLTICRRIVELMDGEIGIESTPDEGSTFWFIIPCGLENNRASSDGEAELPSSEDIYGQSAASLKLLIVEDNEDNYQLLIMMLETLGYQADGVTNGREVLDRLAQEDYDIVLMDCQMPEIDGYEATQQIRQREGNNRHTIIIGLTAHAMKGDRQKCLDAGMDDYLSKPIDLNDLGEMLENWRQKIFNQT